MALEKPLSGLALGRRPSLFLAPLRTSLGAVYLCLSPSLAPGGYTILLQTRMHEVPEMTFKLSYVLRLVMAGPAFVLHTHCCLQVRRWGRDGATCGSSRSEEEAELDASPARALDRGSSPPPPALCRAICQAHGARAQQLWSPEVIPSLFLA